jgi:hypothetical protein
MTNSLKHNHKLLFDTYFDRYTQVEDYLVFPKVQFISIGSASLLKSKNIMFVHEKDNQQYPQFLRNIVNTYHPQTRIILIDPELEMPPNMIMAGQFDKDDKIKFHKWEINPYFNNVFYSSDLKLEVVCFRTSFDYTKHLPYLHLYNFYCLRRRNLLFFHDFSGYDTSKLADYFDDYLGDSHRYIMYDITARSPITCYPDLLDSANNPIVKTELHLPKYSTQPEIRLYIFNPYGFKNADIYKLYTTANKREKLQLKLCVKHKLDNFINIDYPNYRQTQNYLTFYNKMENLVQLIPEDSSQFLNSFHNGLKDLQKDPTRVYKWMDTVKQHINGYFERYYEIKSQ